MWWSVPGSDTPQGDSKVRSLALAGSLQRRQRTVLTMVPLSAVTPNPDQPRKHFAEDALAELAASIRARGLLQPIVVRRSEAAGFQLLAGERRFRAAQLAGLDRVPALIREGDDTLEVALIENLQREDLSPLEEAEALALLIERHDYSHRDVADLLGKSRPYVSNTLALNRLPESVKADLHREGRSISRELLMGIARQETSEAAEALWRRIQLAAVSVRKFRAEKTGKATDRPVLRDVFLAARRFNRALRRLAMEGDPQLELPPEIVRVLRRSERLIQRRLRAISSMSKGIKASL